LVNEDEAETEYCTNDCVYGSIRIFLENFLQTFPKNIDLNILYAYIMTYYLNNIYKALFEMMKMMKRKCTIWQQFEIYLYLKLNNI